VLKGRRLTRRRQERGFTLVILSLTLVSLMIFAAFAVDLGQLYLERRGDQNSADASGTAGAIRFLMTGSIQTTLDEITDRVDADLRPVSDADWAACSDPNNLPRTAATLSTASNPLTPATDCISFSNDYRRLRVRVPDQAVPTAFAGVIGLSEFSSSAFAEVTMEPLGGGGLPFVVLAGAASGDQICLRTDVPNNNPQPPDQPTYGYGEGSQTVVQDPCNRLNFATFNGARGTTNPYEYSTNCAPRSGQTTIVAAIIAGMDHNQGVFEPRAVLTTGSSANALDADPRARLDGPANNSCTSALPNTLELDDGLSAQMLRCALLDVPCASGTARTAGMAGRLSDVGSGASFAERDVEDTPLWDYFVSSLPAAAPSSCGDAADDDTGFYERRQAMLHCLRNWTTGTLFTQDIAANPRFGFVPRIAEYGLCDTQPAPDTACANGSGNLDNVHINSFAPIYMDALYVDNSSVCDTDNEATYDAGTSTELTDWSIHYPGKGLDDCGETSGGPGSQKVDRLSAIVLPCGALPEEVCDPSRNPPFPDAVGINRIRLAK